MNANAIFNDIARPFIIAAVVFALVFQPFTAAAGWFGDDRADASFENLYPEDWYRTTTGKVAIFFGSAVFVGVVTYVTAGTGTAASAGAVSTWIGTKLGVMAGYSGIAATNWGLAFLGGGAVANGGLGILGGVSVLNALGDLSISFAIDQVMERAPTATPDKYSMIKMRIPDEGDAGGLDVLEDLDEVINAFNKRQVSGDLLGAGILEYYDKALNILENKRYDADETADLGYDAMLRAALYYNMGNYERCASALNAARPCIENESVYFYMLALLALTEGDAGRATGYLDRAIDIEPETVIPYILKVQVLMDAGRYGAALRCAESGLAEADKKDFNLLLLAGNLCYAHEEDHAAAVGFFKKALKRVSVNEMEAEIKLMIAKSYRAMGDWDEARDWRDQALEEVEDNPAYAAVIRDAWASVK